jgi:hypothetical protein
LKHDISISRLSRAVLGPKSRAENPRVLLRHITIIILCPLFFAGCTENKPTTQPATWTEQAQADPANFDPQMSDPNISGGDIGHFDKSAFDKDMNDVLNP